MYAQPDRHWKFSPCNGFSSNPVNSVSLHFLYILALEHVWVFPRPGVLAAQETPSFPNILIMILLSEFPPRDAHCALFSE